MQSPQRADDGKILHKHNLYVIRILHNSGICILNQCGYDHKKKRKMQNCISIEKAITFKLWRCFV